MQPQYCLRSSTAPRAAARLDQVHAADRLCVEIECRAAPEGNTTRLRGSVTGDRSVERERYDMENHRRDSEATRRNARSPFERTAGPGCIRSQSGAERGGTDRGPDPGERPDRPSPPVLPAQRNASPTRWQLPILRYRSVPHHSPETALPGALSAFRFEEQLASLAAAGWQLVGITEALDILRQDSSRRVVALTFDDGLLDFLNAFESLLRFGARATLYVPTATVGVRVSRWHRGPSKLDWAELVELRRHGIEIGSQSVHGRGLDVGQEADVAAEVLASKRRLEDRTGSPVTSFSYPHGYSSPRVRRAVAQAGYSIACTLDPRIAGSATDVLALPRLSVRSKVNGGTIQDLVDRGDPGLVPRARRVAMPVWQLARRTTSLRPVSSRRGDPEGEGDR